MKKSKKIILEQTVASPTPLTPSDIATGDWKPVSDNAATNREREGCQIGKFGNFLFYKASSCNNQTTQTTTQTTAAPTPTPTPTPTVPEFETDCDENNMFHIKCKHEKVMKLQRCLNKNKESVYPIIKPNGVWDENTQERLVELYPDYEGGVTSQEIDDICRELSTPKTTEPVYKIRKLESRKSKKLLEQKIDIENDELDVADAKNFFRMAAEYGCLPDWFLYNVDKNNNSPVVYSYPEFKEPFIYGSSKNDNTKKYFFFKDFTAINALTKESKPWVCEKLQKYVRRPIKSSILDKFGIDYKLEHDDMVVALNNVTNVLQTYINKGAVSNDIMSWNNLLKKYANDTEVKKFEFGNRTDVYAPADEDDLNRQYRPYTTQFKNIVVYMPRRADKISSEGPLQGEETKTCAEYLRDYLAHAILYAAGAEEDIMPDIDKVKSAVMRCANSGSYSNITISESDLFKLGFYTNMSKTPFKKISSQLKWKNIVRFLKGENYSGDYDGRALKPENPYSIGRLNESILTSKIKSTLNEIVLEKRKRVLQEDILKKRVQFLMENTTFKSRKQRREFVINLVKETFYVESQGYDKKIIKEEFWDVLKGFFGNEGSEAVFTSFKTRMGEWLTSHLSPKKNDGWIGNCIRKTIQDINMRDVHMITDCKFLSKKIANSVVQKLDEKMSNDKLKDEGLYDIVRGGMSDNVKSANFTNHIEGKVSDMICPILESMSNKFDDAFKGMKKRAIGLQ